MAATNANVLGLPPEEAASLESFLVDFDLHWREGAVADAYGRLSSATNGFRRTALIEMVKIDMDRQWGCGRRPSLLSYLLAYPELGDVSSPPADLIEAEREVFGSVIGGDVAPSMEQRSGPSRAPELMTSNANDDTRSRGAAEEATPTPVRPGLASWQIQADLPEQFGRYRIVRRLGKGGMGTVYLALDSELRREVALKIPSPEASQEPEIIERFLREARAAAALRHPNICPVYDVGSFQGAPYLTMAFIEGRTLREVLKTSAQPTAGDSANLVRKLAIALETAHQRGLLHRDLKPSNIMIDPFGEPIVMDFGLVRGTDAADAQLTQSGALLGTPAYMAPEQVRNDPAALGPATDVYGLGVILYQMLAGRLPFSGATHSLLLQTLNVDPTPPSQFHPGLDARLEAICLKSLAKKPGDRFRSMAEFAAALETFPAALASTAAQPCDSAANPPAAAESWHSLSSTQPRPRMRVLGIRTLAATIVIAFFASATFFLLTGRRDAASTDQKQTSEPAAFPKDDRAVEAHRSAPIDERPVSDKRDDGVAELLRLSDDSKPKTRPELSKSTSDSTRARASSDASVHGKE